MSLDLSKLENVREKGEKTLARCPACAEDGHDKKGEHLIILNDGRFGCVVNSGDSGKKHRQRIEALAGDANARTRGTCKIRVRRPNHEITARPPADLVDLASLGRGETAPPPCPDPDGANSEEVFAENPSDIDLPGRPGRVSQTYARCENKIVREDEEITEKQNVQLSMHRKASGASGTAGDCRNSRPNPSADQSSGSPTRVTDSADFPAIAELISAAGVAAVKVTFVRVSGTPPSGPSQTGLFTLRLETPDGSSWVIDLRRAGFDLGPLKCAFETCLLVFHNAQGDLHSLYARCGIRPRRVFCLRTAGKLLANGTSQATDLDALGRRYLNLPEPRVEEGEGGIYDQQVISPIVPLLDLHDALENELAANGLSEVAVLEMRLIPVVVEIEAAGMPLDLVEVELLRVRAVADAEQARDTMRRLANNPGLNPSNPHQVLSALKRLGLDVPNTNAESLALHSGHPFVGTLTLFRTQSLHATTLEDLARRCGPDGRLHTQLDSLGAETGRLSSSDPCHHSIPRRLRRVFRPSEGMVFVKGDYSQIDLRVAAALAGEEEMLRAFREHRDIHRETASHVTGKALEDITDEERQEAKAVNFGFIYGQKAAGFKRRALADYGLDLSLNRAAELRGLFFERYPAFAEWHRRTEQEATEGLSETRTRAGRRRLFPPALGRWDRFAQAVNTPVQGAAADGMKMALIALHARLPEGARIVLTVHDDVLVECPRGLAEEVSALVEEVMRTEMASLLPEVPIVVETKILDRWE